MAPALSADPTLDYATRDPSAISPHFLECRCAYCERTGGGIWLQMAALEGRVPLDAPVCGAIPVLRSLILDNAPARSADAA